MSAKGKDVKEAFLQALGEWPQCSLFMQSRMISALPEEGSMTISFPVLNTYANPAGSMQAGFYSAAFDNVFGPLCYMATGTPNTVAINLNTEYHRPAFPGDELTITARVVQSGKRKVFMTAKAYNQHDKLVATSSCNYLLLNHNN
jgi:uncharacterized protein (TIGR00369 family)